MPKKLSEQEKKEWGLKMVAARSAKRGALSENKDKGVLKAVNEIEAVFLQQPTQQNVVASVFVAPDPVVESPVVPPGMAWSISSYFDQAAQVTRLRQVLIPV
jgi:hypothetical protein